MRNPLILGVVFPFSKGYCQRLALDTLQRIQLRVLGALICLFGGSIGTHSVAALMKSSSLDAVGEALFVLLIFLFACTFCAGLVIGIGKLVGVSYSIGFVSGARESSSVR